MTKIDYQVIANQTYDVNFIFKGRLRIAPRLVFKGQFLGGGSKEWTETLAEAYRSAGYDVSIVEKVRTRKVLKEVDGNGRLNYFEIWE